MEYLLINKMCRSRGITDKCNGFRAKTKAVPILSIVNPIPGLWGRAHQRSSRWIGSRTCVSLRMSFLFPLLHSTSTFRPSCLLPILVLSALLFIPLFISVRPSVSQLHAKDLPQRSYFWKHPPRILPVNQVSMFSAYRFRSKETWHWRAFGENNF